MYTALKETEQRATDLLPLWKLPFLAPLMPRQRKALEAVALIRAETERLILQCKRMVDAEEQVGPAFAASSIRTPKEPWQSHFQDSRSTKPWEVNACP